MKLTYYKNGEFYEEDYKDLPHFSEESTSVPTECKSGKVVKVLAVLGVVSVLGCVFFNRVKTKKV